MKILSAVLLAFSALASGCLTTHLYAVESSEVSTPLQIENLDPGAFAQWSDGQEKPCPIGFDAKPKLPESILWTIKDGVLTTPVIAYGDMPGLVYGDSKSEGVRHLRVGFQTPVLVGSVLTLGAGRLSVLKPDAPYPGNLNDDSQWIPAQRIVDNRVDSSESKEDDEVVWTLPSAVSTRAIRFTHVAAPTDSTYGASLRSAFLFSERFVNLAPQAMVTARSSIKDAVKLTNGKYDSYKLWDNMPEKGDDTSKPVSVDPEWVMLTWPQAVTVKSLVLLGTGFTGAEVQAFQGAASQHPSTAPESDWKTVSTDADLKNLYLSVPVDVLDAGGQSTRALRLRVNATMDEAKMDQRFPGRTRGGRRIWLDEIMALQDLKTADLKTAIVPPKKTNDHPPIAIDLDLPEDAYVSLVIEDSTGKRVRNLISETPFSKGKNTVYWDGTNDLGRDTEAASHGIYSIPTQLVAPGDYTVRGLWRRKIDLRYQMSIYSPGNPPWVTQDTTGGWMTTHTPASSTLFIPGSATPDGIPLVLIGAYICEGGSALSWLDLNGSKKGGRGYIGGAWTGAQYLSRDNGPDAVPGIYAYAGSTLKLPSGPNEKEIGEIRLTGLTAFSSQGDKQILAPPYQFDFPAGAEQGENMGGLAVYNGLVVFSQPSFNQLVFVDAKAGKVIGTAPVQKPRALAFDAKGRLLVLSGQQLLRFTLAASPLPLGTAETVTADLKEPVSLTLDDGGDIYVSDRGTDNQVKVFSPDGKKVRSYGTPGVAKAGIYDPNHINSPRGITVDANGRLWVTEEVIQPKRVSVWNKDGTLWKAYYGGPLYGGGGALDPENANAFYYGGMEFQLDWKSGQSNIKRVFYKLDDPMFDVDYFAPPETAFNLNGKHYLTNAYNSSPVSGASVAFLFRDMGDTILPAAAMGEAHAWKILKTDAYKSTWPEGVDLVNPNNWGNMATFCWSDLNADGKIEPDEVTMVKGFAQGVSISKDASFLAPYFGPYPAQGHAVEFKPVKFTKEGIPVYDLAKGDILGDAQNPPSDGGGQLLVGTDGWVVQTTAPPPFSGFGLGGSHKGVGNWSYPSLWPGLHAAHSSPPPDRLGELIGATRLLGDLVTPKNSDAGPLFFINNNQGAVYVFTQDGLFVAQLFRDIREGGLRWSMSKAPQGMLVNDLSLSDENFFPTVSQVKDGSIYLNTGGTMSLVKVEGLNSVHRIAPKPVHVTAEKLELAQADIARQEITRQATQGTGILKVSVRSQAPVLDEGLKSWADVDWASIDQRGVAAFFDSNTKPYNVNGAMTVADGKLFAIWKSGEVDLLKNSGEIDNAPFKTGGALDLMLGVDASANPQRVEPVAGDLRLLVTQVKGATKAVLYRSVVPGTQPKDKVPFSAPWHSITFDSVTDVSGQVQLTTDGKGNYQVAVPLELLGLKPGEGSSVKGDMGVLRGDGIQTTQRVYWNNKATAIVSDVPSEAMLTPSLWGTLKFEKQ